MFKIALNIFRRWFILINPFNLLTLRKNWTHLKTRLYLLFLGFVEHSEYCWGERDRFLRLIILRVVWIIQDRFTPGELRLYFPTLGGGRSLGPWRGSGSFRSCVLFFLLRIFVYYHADSVVGVRICSVGGVIRHKSEGHFYLVHFSFLWKKFLIFNCW